MTMEQECKFALIQFGECDKNGYVFVKGGNFTLEQVRIAQTYAHTYWYPDGITQEEAQQEIEDLVEFYDNVAIFVPLPDNLNNDILTRSILRQTGSTGRRARKPHEPK